MLDHSTLPGIPVLAVLRGITPDEILPIADSLITAGIRRIEVTLNSPGALASIQSLVTAWPQDVLIGAGTVLNAQEVARLSDIGCHLVVSPNFSAEVVRATKAADMLSCPGVFTPSEAFSALSEGADLLKYFPAELNGPAAITAWRAVLPDGTPIIATGGTNAETLSSWLSSNVDMIGVGSALFTPGDTCAAVALKAKRLADAFAEFEARHG
ncbi:2-dehydro-3-deoxy-6-phosphogalactonate aldolase [Phycobacter sp. K97]|uniref:2-dehydro-3-deoxy-6-phosphogalactonate aldolase n=1 Tax=Phycobacter sedimenti TaxID=3133977 RepID=UPI00311FD491